jgi:DNA-binding MarR family transcriptional regulator
MFHQGVISMDRHFLGSIIERYEEASLTVERKMHAAISERIPSQLTIDQYWIIRYLRKRDRSTSSELADMFCVGKSSITAITTRLCDKNLIVRIPDGHDRRVIYLQLTREGERLADEIGDRIKDVLMLYLNHFEEQETIRFIETYEKLAGVLTQT